MSESKERWDFIVCLHSKVIKQLMSTKKLTLLWDTQLMIYILKQQIFSVHRCRFNNAVVFR